MFCGAAVAVGLPMQRVQTGIYNFTLPADVAKTTGPFNVSSIDAVPAIFAPPPRSVLVLLLQYSSVLYAPLLTQCLRATSRHTASGTLQVVARGFCGSGPLCSRVVTHAGSICKQYCTVL